MQILKFQGDKVGHVVMSAVDNAVESGWGKAQVRAGTITGETIDARVKSYVKSVARELATTGAAVGGTAAAPGVGTAVAVVASVVDIAYVTKRSCDMMLVIAALHGHEAATVEERKMWLLTVLAFGDTASATFAKIAAEAGKGLGRKAVGAIPAKSLLQINRVIGRTILTKYGTKRGAVALGRLLPFGFGAAIGGTANYVTTRTLARHTNKFFTELPYDRIES